MRKRGNSRKTENVRYSQNCYESGSANGMKEMSICGALRRLMPSDVRSVRLRSIRLAAHPHLEHFSHAVVHPRRVVAHVATPRAYKEKRSNL